MLLPENPRYLGADALDVFGLDTSEWAGTFEPSAETMARASQLLDDMIAGD